MAKSHLTKCIEKNLMWSINTDMNRNIKCLEVSVNDVKIDGRNKIVDLLRYDCLKHDFVCYEIKISKQDFNSKNGHNLVGNRNYYVVPHHLLDYVKEKTKGSNIGIMTSNEFDYCTIRKHCKRVEIDNELSNLLMLNLSKALQREYKKLDWKLKYEKR
jgi:hypothetical protein